MKAIRGVMIICLISFLFIQPVFQSDYAYPELGISIDESILTQIGLENHLPIRIRSDSEFASIASSEGWVGNGSSSNPYIIENLTIRANVTVDPEYYEVEVEHPIHISDTLSSFIIRNCQFLNDPDDDVFFLGIGILLDNVENCIIDSCNIEGLEECIDLDDCTNIEVVNCTTVQTWRSYGAIYGAYCQNVTIVNNTIFNGSIGFWNSFTCNISINTISGSISISDCDQCIIIDNEIKGGGLGVYHYYEGTSNTIFGNTVDGLPIEYYGNQIGIVLDLSGIGQLILDNCSDVIARNGYFDTAIQGVTFYYCTNCTLEDSEFIETRFYLRFTIGCRISNVTTVGAYESELSFTTYCVIENCVLMGEFNGFALYESYNCIINNCSFIDNKERGLVIHHAHNNTIANCTFSNNRDGIYNSIADNNTFTGNIIMDNQLTGLVITQSSGCVATENKIYDNRFGMEVSYSTNTIVHSNEFGWNTQHVVIFQASSTSWDNGIDQGNYWSGYDGDGIVFLTFGDWDNYPTPLLLAQGPEQLVYLNGTTGHQIKWNCSALYPVSYTIYFEGNEIESGDWDGDDISVAIDGLAPGSYTYTLSVTEIYGHIESSSVNVTVTDGSTTSTSPHPIVIIYILVIVGVAGVVVVVIIVYKVR